MLLEKVADLKVHSVVAETEITVAVATEDVSGDKGRGGRGPGQGGPGQGRDNRGGNTPNRGPRK